MKLEFKINRKIFCSHPLFENVGFLRNPEFSVYRCSLMGHVRTKTTKRAARVIIEKHYLKLSDDFQNNKRVCDEVATIHTKRMRNKIAGYVTHLYKRLQEGPVRGISLKLQEEERERKDNYVPEKSAIDLESHTVDSEVYKMIEALGFSHSACLMPATQ